MISTTSGGRSSPAAGRDRITFFVVIDIVEHRLHGFACKPTCLAQSLLQARPALVTPAAFHHEVIPDHAIIVRAGRANCVSPSQDFVV